MEKISFETIALVGRPDLADHRKYLLDLVRFLELKKKQILLDDNLAKVLRRKPTTTAAIRKNSDAIISFGGDGTFLGVIEKFWGTQAAFVGVKLRGSLGFLTEHDPKKLKTILTGFCRGECLVGERILLAAEVLRKKKSAKKLRALNEFVIRNSCLSRMIELPLALDERTITTYHADGVLVATPTGSTAYSLSAGGPIVYPSLSAIVINPINPHTLTARPIVVPDDREIEVEIKNEGVILTADGQRHFDLKVGDKIVFRKAAWTLRVLHSRRKNYFETLREKLGWGGERK